MRLPACIRFTRGLSVLTHRHPPASIDACENARISSPGFRNRMFFMQTATVAGGCFWCLEPVFTALRGVHKAVSGYTGGATPNPNYRQVCTGSTGHAEAVQIEFDPDVISYRALLEIFFAFHNPTTLNQQGADRGTQYRSAIFYHSPEQKREAEQLIAELDAARIWTMPIVTRLEPGVVFHPAEDYHQGYYALNPDQRYCQVMIDPKIQKLREHYADRLKPA